MRSFFQHQAFRNPSVMIGGSILLLLLAIALLAPLLTQHDPMQIAPRFRLRMLVDYDDFDGIAARGIRFVVFHKNMNEELGRGDFEAVDPASVIERYRARFGEPVSEDARSCVFDVRALPDVPPGD